ncbi:Cell division ATP-binding protein FtsE [Corynebacterium canis]|uniref:ATP-binding cassette domain-containing protein n=1 Tax=Corynebacterium canis TaxID=679663 RepID=UPI001647DC87|nr:ATP-binding cassette domain-containing protein [Corynebacterium canis]WJY75494.1 Cell division ATP-binding protein FtsE [Corynebacterium canis]
MAAQASQRGCCALDGVRIAYQGTQILHVPQFRIDSPCRVALLGPSGAGKSSFAALLGDFLANDAAVSGDIARPASIGAVAQDSFGALNPLMRIIDQVALTSSSRKAAAERLEAVGLGEQLHRRYPLQLSGGQRQRAAIALAIGTSPELLIADEITSALDPIASAEVIKTLRRLTGPGTATSLLLITHNEAVAYALCERIIRFHPNGEEAGFVALEAPGAAA